jgi:hypothetical protein
MYIKKKLISQKERFYAKNKNVHVRKGGEGKK